MIREYSQIFSENIPVLLPHGLNPTDSNRWK